MEQEQARGIWRSIKTFRIEKIEPKNIISKVITFDEIPHYIEELSENPDDYLKIIAVI